MFTRERLTRWSNSLRANPQKQYIAGSLANSDYSKVCCLGELCEVEGLERLQWSAGFIQDGFGATGVLHVDWQLTKDFGSDDGSFDALGMPWLSYDDKTWSSVASANDASVPWSVIADHFDKHYPCSDEV